MRNWITIIIFVSGVVSATLADDTNSRPDDQNLSHIDGQMFIVLTGDEEFYASGIEWNQNFLIVSKWRVSENDSWNLNQRTIPAAHIVRIEFKSNHENHSRHWMHLEGRGWIWGGVMILMMLVMITGGIM